jgi:hypothetical protein
VGQQVRRERHALLFVENCSRLTGPVIGSDGDLEPAAEERGPLSVGEPEAEVVDAARPIVTRPARLEGVLDALPADLEVHGLLDPAQVVQPAGELGRIGDLDEQRRAELPLAGDEVVEDLELLTNALRLVDALGAQKLLDDPAHCLAILEHQAQQVAEQDAPMALELDDSAPRVGANGLVGGWRTDISEGERLHRPRDHAWTAMGAPRARRGGPSPS